MSKHCPILIIFGTSIAHKLGNEKLVYFFHLIWLMLLRDLAKHRSTEVIFHLGAKVEVYGQNQSKSSFSGHFGLHLHCWVSDQK